MKLNDMLRYVVLAGIFLIPILLPVVIASSLFFPFITGKGFFFRAIVELTVAAWAILAVLDRAYRPRYSHILASVAAFVGIIFLADIFGANPFKSFWSNFERMEGWFLFLHLFGYFLVLGTMLTAERLWDRFFHTWIGIGVFLGLFGIVQLSGEAVINQGGVRLDGTFGNAAYFAGFLLLMTFLCLRYMVARHKERFSLLVQSVTVGTLMFIGHALYLYSERKAEVMVQFGRLPENFSFFLGPIQQWLFLLSASALFFVAAMWFYRKKITEIAWASFAVSFVFALTPLFYFQNYGEIRLAFVLISLIPLLFLFFASRYRAREERVIPILVPLGYAAIAALEVAMLFFTATRGAILALVGALVLVAILIAIGERKDVLLRRVAVGALLLLILSIGAFFIFKNSAFVKDNEIFSRLASISLKEGETRFTIWGMALEGVKDRPILGWGQENFNFVFNTYYRPSLYAQEQWFDRTHNIVFDWLVVGGFLGFAAYLSMYGVALYWLWRRRVAEDEAGEGFTAAEKAVITGVFAAYFFQNFFVFDNIVSYVLFFSMLAYLHRAYARPASAGKAVRGRVGLRTLLIISIIVLLSVSLYVFVYRGIRTGELLIQALRPHYTDVDRKVLDRSKNVEYFKRAAESAWLGRQEVMEQAVVAATQTAGSDAPETVKMDFYELAKKLATEELERNPKDTRIWTFSGSLDVAYGKYDEAIRAMEQALALSPDKQSIMTTLGSLYVSVDKEKAYAVLKEAYTSAPKYEVAEEMYLVAAVYAGKFEEVNAHLKGRYDAWKAGGKTFFIEQRVVQALGGAGKFKELVNWLERGVEADPGRLEYRLSLAVGYFEIGRRADAIASLEVAKKLAPQSEAQLNFYIGEIKAGRRP